MPAVLDEKSLRELEVAGGLQAIHGAADCFNCTGQIAALSVAADHNASSGVFAVDGTRAQTIADLRECAEFYLAPVVRQIDP